MARSPRDEWPIGAGFQYHLAVLSPRTVTQEMPPVSTTAEGPDDERGAEVTG